MPELRQDCLRLARQRQKALSASSASAPEQRKQNDDGDRYAQQPEQNASTHDIPPDRLSALQRSSRDKVPSVVNRIADRSD